MNFAYLILAHKDPDQVCRLVQSLNTNESKFIIHIDSKVEIRPFLRLFENYPEGKIFFCPGRKSIDWGSYSMVEATMAMIQFMFKMELEVDYVHLISGQDYPVMSNYEIEQFFKTNSGKNFIEFFSLPDDRWRERGLLRINWQWGINEHKNIFYNDLDYKAAYPPLPHLPDGIIPYGGSQWWSLHIDCVRFIMEEYDCVSDLFKFYRYSFIPDEMLFQTLLLNSHFKDTVVNDNFRFIKFSNGSWHPETIGLGHLEELSTKGKLFARKFEYGEDKAVLDHLDKNRNNNLNPTDNEFIQKPSPSIRLESIARILMLNASFIENLGLFNGKMGIAIFFFHYYGYNNNKLYERFAKELLDEICEEISNATPIDIANGLVGIGWGIEYLVRNNYIAADTDEILEEIDNALYSSTMQTPFTFQNLTALLELGLYFISRLKGNIASVENPAIIKKKEILLFILDGLEKLFTKSGIHNLEYSQLSLSLINSVLWFITQTLNLELSPEKSYTFILELAQYLSKEKGVTSDSLDLLIFNILIQGLDDRMNENAIKSESGEIRDKIRSIKRPVNENEPLTIPELIKAGWNSLIYSIKFKDLVQESKILTLTGLVNEVDGNFYSGKQDENHLYLYDGLTGLGLTHIYIIS